MWNRDWAASAALLLASLSALAETAVKPDAAASASAESAAAMERAKRQAAGPMRFILEAAKGRRKGAEAETPSAADASAVRPVANRSMAVAPSVSEPAPRPAATAPQPIAVAAPALAVATPAPTASPVLTRITSDPGAFQAKPVAGAVQGLERTALAPPVAALPAAALSLPSLAVGPVTPQLLSQGDIELSARALDGVTPGTVVQIELKLRTDGSVAEVKLINSVPRTLARELVPMLQQWRFKPLTSEQLHRLEVVLNRQ